MPLHLTAEDWHNQFVNDVLMGRLLQKPDGRPHYTDGGPSSLNRRRKRAAGKRARAARRANR